MKVCKRCDKQDDNCFEVRGESFCSEKCCYEWTKEDNQRKEKQKEVERKENNRKELENKKKFEDRVRERAERWEEIEDEIFFLKNKRDRFGLTEEDLKEVKSLQTEINSLLEEEGDKWILRNFKKRDLRGLKWWQQDPDPNDRRTKKDLFTQLKEEIQLLKERINELESKPSPSEKEKNWLKNNKRKLSNLEQKLLQSQSTNINSNLNMNTAEREREREQNLISQ